MYGTAFDHRHLSIFFFKRTTSKSCTVIFVGCCRKISSCDLGDMNGGGSSGGPPLHYIQVSILVFTTIIPTRLYIVFCLDRLFEALARGNFSCTLVILQQCCKIEGKLVIWNIKDVGIGGRSANKFSKSQIRKFSDLNNLLDLRTFLKCGT
jgi:hypothetical protein